MINILYTTQKELRLGWKIIRAMLLFILTSIIFALSISLTHLKSLSTYAIPLSMILSTFLCLRLEKRKLRDIGLSFNEEWLKNFLLGIVFSTCAILVIVAYMLIISKELNSSAIFQAFNFKQIVNNLFYYFLIAVGEEALFRGYFINVFQSRFNTSIGIVAASIIFSLIHVVNPDYYWFAFVYAFLMGILLGFIYLQTGSLWFGIGFHFAWNFLQSESIFNVSETGGELIFTAVLMSCFIGAYIFTNLIDKESVYIGKSL